MAKIYNVLLLNHIWTRNWENSLEEVKWFSKKLIHNIWESIKFLKEFVQNTLRWTLLFIDFSTAFDSQFRGKTKQILQVLETAAAIMMLYKKTKVKVCSPDKDADFFDIVTGVLSGDTLALHQFIICLDNIFRISIDLVK